MCMCIYLLGYNLWAYRPSCKDPYMSMQVQVYPNVSASASNHTSSKHAMIIFASRPCKEWKYFENVILISQDVETQVQMCVQAPAQTPVQSPEYKCKYKHKYTHILIGNYIHQIILNTQVILLQKVL